MLNWRKDKQGDEGPSGSPEPGQARPSQAGAPPTRTSPPSPEAPLTPLDLGRMLLQEQYITQQQLDQALDQQHQNGGFLGQVLVDNHAIEQKDLISFLVKHCKIPHLSLLDYEINRDLLELVPQDVCLRHKVLPIDKLGRILTLAMVDPLDTDALQEIREVCPQLKIKPILCDWNHYQQVTRQLFGSQGRSSQQITASSLGLSERPSASKPAQESEQQEPERPTPDQSGAQHAAAVESKPAQEATKPQDSGEAQQPRQEETPKAQGSAPQQPKSPQPQASETEPQATPTQTAIAPADQAREMAGILEAGLHESLKEAVSAIAREFREAASQPAAPNPGPVIDTRELAEAMDASIRTAMSEGLGGLAGQLREALAVSTEAKAQPSGVAAEELTAVVERSVHESLQEAMGSLAEQFQQANPPAVTGFPSSEELASMLQASLRGAMQESLTELAQTLGAQREGPAAAAPFSADELMQAGEAIRGAAASMQEALTYANQHRHEEAGGQTAQYAELSKAAQEVVQAAQAAMEAARTAAAASQSTAEQTEANHAALRRRFNTVQPFRSGQAGQSDNERASLEAVAAPEDERVREALDANKPLAGFSFDTFFVSKSNQFTVNLSRKIAEAPGGDFNPFFLYGAVGIGKTHLVNAAGNVICEADSKRRVGYVSAGRFARLLLEAIHAHAADAFRDAYCHWDVLILDDIQFLGGHVEAQEEFFHIFNALYQAGRQIVIAADKPPDQLGQLEQRLISRFAGGIVARLEAPDYETRMKILKHHVRQTQAGIPDEALAIIAARIPSDVRKLCGALRKVIAYAGLAGKEISCDTVYETLSHMGVSEAAYS